METMPLRELVRHPKTVKKLTAAGKPVRITDNGEPLWLVMPDLGLNDEDNEEARTQAWEEYYADLLKRPLKKALVPSLSQVVLEARGNR